MAKRIRWFESLLMSVLALLMTSTASAQPGTSTGYPERSVTLVVPFLAGGSMDALARITARQLSQIWKQPVTVQNVPGGGGLTGALRVKDGPADGYTLLMTNSALVQNAIAAAGPPPYDPVDDFVPIVHMTQAPVVYVINPGLEAQTLKEFVDLMRKDRGAHSFASSGANQTLHLLGALFNLGVGVDMAHIAFDGEAAVVENIMNGTASAGFATISTAGPLIADGKLRALGVAGPRSPALPNVPGFEEIGLPQLGVVDWFGLFAPAGTPTAVVERVAADVTKILQAPEIEQRLLSMSLPPTGLGPQEFARIVKRDVKYWNQVIKQVGEK